MGDDQCRKSDSTVRLRVALSMEMKNRQPSILYSSSGFLCPKLLTLTCVKFQISSSSTRKRKSSNLRKKAYNITAELSLFIFTRWSLQKQSKVFTRTVLWITSKNIGTKKPIMNERLYRVLVSKTSRVILPSFLYVNEVKH